MTTPDEWSRDALSLAATGLPWEDVALLGELDEAARQQYAHDRGGCCWAGLVAAPEPCPWHHSTSIHSEDMIRDAQSEGEVRMIEDEGSPDRFYLGIDGTMGDAQDVPHPFLASVHGEHCRVCGLARTYRKHDA